MKAFIASAAMILGLCLCGTAAAQDLRNPDQVAPAPAAYQDLRNPDQVAAAPTTTAWDRRNPDRTMYAAPTVADRAVSAPAVVAPSSDGLGALWIVLISTGGALVLAGAAYTTVRVVHRHPDVA
jgi:hypothetical protein